MPGKQSPKPTTRPPDPTNARTPQLPKLVGAPLNTTWHAASAAARRLRRPSTPSPPSLVAANGLAREARARASAVLDALAGRRRPAWTWTWFGGSIAAGVGIGLLIGSLLRSLAANRPVIPSHELEFVDVDRITPEIGQRTGINRPM